MSIVVLILSALMLISNYSAYMIITKEEEETIKRPITIEEFEEPSKLFEQTFVVLSDKPSKFEDELRTTLELAKHEAREYIEEPIEETDLVMDPEYIRQKYPKAIKYIAKTLYGECRGSIKQDQAAVVWCILNRVDTCNVQNEAAIINTITAKNQFTGYRKHNPIWPNLEEIAIDVLGRWELEKLGETDVGRVLPKEYKWFLGYNGRNHFRDAYRNGKIWDWSLENPYD